MESVCVRAFAEALEVVPYTLSENAGLNPINIVTELRRMHAAGEKYSGINVKKVCVCVCLEGGGSRYNAWHGRWGQWN
jgi:T-complex protein 1 subunit delta